MKPASASSTTARGMVPGPGLSAVGRRSCQGGWIVGSAEGRAAKAGIHHQNARSRRTVEVRHRRPSAARTGAEEISPLSVESVAVATVPRRRFLCVAFSRCVHGRLSDRHDVGAAVQFSAPAATNQPSNCRSSDPGDPEQSLSANVIPTLVFRHLKLLAKQHPPRRERKHLQAYLK